MIPLMKHTFLNEKQTKKDLAEFIAKSDRLSMGHICAEFEKKFAEYQGSKHAILFNSGASANLALMQALKNLGRLKPGDKVGFSALTWSTNVMPIIQMGFEPVPIDCEIRTLNVSSQTLENRLKETDLKALFITNALGFTGDLDNIKKICSKKKIIFIEDNCEALGSELPSGKAGTFGLAASYSFFVAHHMSTIEGGMLCTSDDELAEMARIVRANGWDRNLTPEQQEKWRKKFKVNNEYESKYVFYDLAYNLRPTEITGFLGIQQMQYLEENIKKRQKNYRLLESVVEKNKELIPFDTKHMSVVSSFAFPIICRDAKAMQKYLLRFFEAEIEIRPVIAGNIQKQPFYTKYVKTFYDLPNTDFIHNHGFYCGNYPELSKEDLKIIMDCLKP
ncbi:MAG: DegT/DnrJ/EryC1/StrS aminotransferase family protein [Candidatus Nanoarchaeia archaeon]